MLQETVTHTRAKLVAEFDHVNEHYIHGGTIEGFLECIERHRLTHLPHRGSRWDKVLKWAEQFILQISRYSKIVKPFVLGSEQAAQLL